MNIIYKDENEASIKSLLDMSIMLLILVGLWVAADGVLAQRTIPLLPKDKPTAASVPSSPTLLDCHGDPLPPKALARLGSVRLRHLDSFIRMDMTGLVAFSHNGQALFASTGDRNRLRQWDIATGKLIRQFPDESGNPMLIVPSSDGSTLATCSKGGQVFLWNIATGQLLHRWNSNAFALRFSPDGKTLTASCRDRRVRIWEVASGKELPTREIQGMDAKAETFVLSATSTLLVSVRQKDGKVTVQVWDVATGKQRHELPHLKDSPFSISPWSIAFSPDGRFLATASTSDVNVGGFEDKSNGAVYLWDMITGKSVRQICLDKAGTRCLAFSPDGKLLVTGSIGGSVRLWEVATGKELPCRQEYGAHILSVAFSSDGTRLAAGSGGNDQTVRVWEVATGKEITPALGGHTGAILSLDFTPDGKSLVSGGRDGRVCLWDVETSRERRPPLRAGDYQAFAAMSADGKSIVSSGKVFAPHGGIYQEAVLSAPEIVRVWDVVTGQEKHHFSSGEGCAQSLSLSADGRSLLVVDYKYKGEFLAGIWDVMAGRNSSFHDAGSSSMNAVFSPDHKMYAIRSVENTNGRSTVSLFDVATGKKLDHCVVPPSNNSQGLTFSSDSQQLATVGMSADLGRNNLHLSIYLWHLGSDKTPRFGSYLTITGHEGEISALVMSPDGRTIASAGEKGTIQVWETVSGKERCRLNGHQGEIWCLAFSRDGRQIASGSNDTTILLWNVTGRLEHGKLRSTVLTAQALEQLWTDLGGSDASKAGQAIWSLVAAPDQAVAFLKKQLVPVPIKKGLEQRIAQLIKQLDDDKFQVRKKALSELTKLGEIAEPTIRRTLETPTSAETKKRLKQLLASLTQKKTFSSGEDCRCIRALEILEQCGTVVARQLVESLSQGEPTVLLTREAKASLARLSRRVAR